MSMQRSSEARRCECEKRFQAYCSCRLQLGLHRVPLEGVAERVWIDGTFTCTTPMGLKGGYGRPRWTGS